MSASYAAALALAESALGALCQAHSFLQRVPALPMDDGICVKGRPAALPAGSLTLEVHVRAVPELRYIVTVKYPAACVGSPTGTELYATAVDHPGDEVKELERVHAAIETFVKQFTVSDDDLDMEEQPVQRNDDKTRVYLSLSNGVVAAEKADVMDM